MNLGPGKEFDRIRAIIARVAEITGDGSGLGDDCALIPLGATTLALSIDSSVEDVHFRTDWLDFKEIGFRAAGSAFSDLAADGASPIGVLVSIGLPTADGKEGGDTDPAAEIMAGVATMARNLAARVLGGDLTRADKYSVDVCVLGTADHPVRRSGAREAMPCGSPATSAARRWPSSASATASACPRLSAIASRVPSLALPPDGGWRSMARPP